MGLLLLHEAGDADNAEHHFHALNDVLPKPGSGLLAGITAVTVKESAKHVRLLSTTHTTP